MFYVGVVVVVNLSNNIKKLRRKNHSSIVFIIFLYLSFLQVCVFHVNNVCKEIMIKKKMGKWTITTTTKHTTPQHYNMYKNKNNINQQGNDGGNEIKKKKQASNIYIHIRNAKGSMNFISGLILQFFLYFGLLLFLLFSFEVTFFFGGLSLINFLLKTMNPKK